MINLMALWQPIGDTMSNSNRNIASSTTSYLENKMQPESQERITIESFLRDITDANGVIDVSTLEKMGGGGTHDIFRSRLHPELLFKVMRDTAGKNEDEISRHLQMHDDQCEVLYETFGTSRCIVENRSIKPIKNYNSNDKTQVAIISVVPFDSCFESKEKFGFNVSPIELDPFLIESRPHLYQIANKELLGGKHIKPSPYVMNNYPLLNPQFENIFKLLDTEPSLVVVMREFLTKYKTFYKRSGALLDTVGLDNVVFYKNDHGWQFKLGSVIKHDTSALTKKTLQEIKTNPAIVNESPLYSTSVFLMPACIRALNACAEKVGIGKVIDDIDLDENTINILATMHEQLGKGTRILSYAKHGQLTQALALFQQYVPEEKEYNTELRDTMGTHYWEHIKKSGQASSQEEVTAYLNMLSDPRNDFPDFRKKAVEEAIAGLSKQQRSYLTEETKLDINNLSSTARAASKLGIQPQIIPEEKNAVVLDHSKSTAIASSPKTPDLTADEISNNEMVESAFGQASDTAKKLRH